MVNEQVRGSAGSPPSRVVGGGFLSDFARKQIERGDASEPVLQLLVWLGEIWPLLSRHTSPLSSYRVQFQDSDIGSCVGTNCGKSFLWESVSLGVD